MYKSANWSRLLTIINFLCIDRWQIDHLKVLRGSFPKTLDCLRWKRYSFTRLFIGKFSANAKKLSVLRGKSLKKGIKFKFMDLSYFSPWFSNECLKKAWTIRRWNCWSHQRCDSAKMLADSVLGLTSSAGLWRWGPFLTLSGLCPCCQVFYNRKNVNKVGKMSTEFEMTGKETQRSYRIVCWYRKKPKGRIQLRCIPLGFLENHSFFTYIK